MQFLYCATIVFSERYVGQLYQFCSPKHNKQLSLNISESVGLQCTWLILETTALGFFRHSSNTLCFSHQA